MAHADDDPVAFASQFFPNPANEKVIRAVRIISALDQPDRLERFAETLSKGTAKRSDELLRLYVLFLGLREHSKNPAIARRLDQILQDSFRRTPFLRQLLVEAVLQDGDLALLEQASTVIEEGMKAQLRTRMQNPASAEITQLPLLQQVYGEANLLGAYPEIKDRLKLLLPAAPIADPESRAGREAARMASALDDSALGVPLELHRPPNPPRLIGRRDVVTGRLHASSEWADRAIAKAARTSAEDKSASLLLEAIADQNPNSLKTLPWVSGNSVREDLVALVVRNGDQEDLRRLAKEVFSREDAGLWAGLFRQAIRKADLETLRVYLGRARFSNGYRGPTWDPSTMAEFVCAFKAAGGDLQDLNKLQKVKFDVKSPDAYEPLLNPSRKSIREWSMDLERMRERLQAPSLTLSEKAALLGRLNAPDAFEPAYAQQTLDDLVDYVRKHPGTIDGRILLAASEHRAELSARPELLKLRGSERICAPLLRELEERYSLQ